MRKVSTLVCSIVLGLFVTGCASVVSWISEGGLDQEMSFTSEPPGAQLFLNGGVPIGVTPLLKVKIERSKINFIVAKKEGFEDQSVLLTSDLPPLVRPPSQ